MRKRAAARRRRRQHVLIFVAGVACAAFCSSCASPGGPTRRAALTYSRYLKGLMSERRGDFQEALKFHEQAKSLDPSAPGLHLHAGFDYIRLEKYPEAVFEFEKALTLEPDNDVARTVLAALYVQLADYKKAVSIYEKLLARHSSLRSQNIKLRHILSQLYFLQEDRVSVRRHVSAILELDAADTDALYFLAVLDTDAGRVKEAEAGFRKVLAADPENADAMNALAYLFAEQETRLAEALELAESALSRDAENGAYLDTLGWIYFKLGETKKAVGFLEKAAEATMDSVILNHLAEAYLKQGRLEDAQKRWTSSLILNPRQSEVREKLKALKQK